MEPEELQPNAHNPELTHNSGTFDLDGQTLDTDRIGRFTLRRELGRGGMGVVYEAFDEKLKRVVALKTLPPRKHTSQSAMQRFQIEARASAKLNHDSIVPVYTVDEHVGVPYYAMKLVTGTDLSRIIDEARSRSKKGGAAQDETLPVAAETETATREAAKRDSTRGNASNSTFTGEFLYRSHQSSHRAKSSAELANAIASLGSEIAAALHHAHDNGIIHRDIKPSNLLVDENFKVWVSDFGLAHLNDAPSITQTGEIIGTLRYMSPEQASGRRAFVDHRTDIYSLGATLYEIATLQPMCKGRNTSEILRELTLGRPIPIRKVNPRFSKDFETVLCKATERNPADRYATAGEMAEDLDRIARGQAISTRRVSPFKRVLDVAVAHPGIAAGAIASTAIIMLLLAWSLMAALDSKRKSEIALRKMTAGRMIAEMSLKLESDPGGAIAYGLATPDMEDNVEGVRLMMQAIDQNHELKTIGLKQKSPGTIAWNPNLDLLLVCNNAARFGEGDQCWLADSKLHKLIGPLESSGEVTSAAFSPVGSFLLTTGSSFGPYSAVKYGEADFAAPVLWNARTRQREQEFRGARLAMCTPDAFSADGKKLVLPDRSGGATIYSIGGTPDKTRLTHNSHAKAAVMGGVFSKSQRHIATWMDDGRITLFDAISGDLLAEWTLSVRGQSSLRADFSPDSKWLMATSDRGTMLVDVDAFQKQPIYRNDRLGCFVGEHHDVALLANKHVRLFSPTQREVLSEVEVPHEARMFLTAVGSSHLVTVRHYDQVYLVDLELGTITAQLRGHSDHILDVSAPEYSSAIATVGWDKTLRFWREESDVQTRTLDSDLYPFVPPTVGYSADGKFAAIGSVQEYLTWSGQLGAPEHAPLVSGRAFCSLPDGSYFVGLQGTLQRHDHETGRKLGEASFGDLLQQVHAVDEKTVAVTTYAGNAFLWNVDGSPVKVNRLGESMRLYPIAGQKKVAAAVDNEIRIIATDTLEATVLANGLQVQVVDMSVSPSGDRIAVLNREGEVVVHSLDEQSQPLSFSPDFKAQELLFADAQTLIIHQGRTKTQILAWDLQQNQQLGAIECGYITTVEMLDDREAGDREAGDEATASSEAIGGKIRCLIATSSGAYLWDAASPEPEMLFDGPISAAKQVGENVLVAARITSEADSTGSGISSCQLIDPDSKAIVAEHTFDLLVLHAQYSKQSKYLQLSGEAYGLDLYDLESQTKLRRIRGQDQGMVLAEFSDDGKQLVTVSNRGAVIAANLDTGENTTICRLDHSVTSAAISPDRQWLVVADSSGKLTEWDLASKSLSNEHSMDSPVTEVCFGGGNSVFATVHGKSTLTIWNRGGEQQEPIVTLPFDEELSTISLSPDSSTVMCVFGTRNSLAARTRENFPFPPEPELKTRAVLVDVKSQARTELPGEFTAADGHFYNDGKQIALLCSDGSITLFDSGSNQPRGKLEANERAISLLDIAPNCPLILAVTKNMVLAWDSQTGEKKLEISGVVSSSTLHGNLRGWKVDWQEQDNLLLIGDQGPLLFPRRPLDYARQVAPRGLEEAVRRELLLAE